MAAFPQNWKKTLLTTVQKLKIISLLGDLIVYVHVVVQCCTGVCSCISACCRRLLHSYKKMHLINRGMNKERAYEFFVVAVQVYSRVDEDQRRWYFQSFPLLSYSSYSTAFSLHSVLNVTLGTCPTIMPPFWMATALELQALPSPIFTKSYILTNHRSPYSFISTNNAEDAACVVLSWHLQHMHKLYLTPARMNLFDVCSGMSNAKISKPLNAIINWNLFYGMHEKLSVSYRYSVIVYTPYVSSTATEFLLCPSRLELETVYS